MSTAKHKSFRKVLSIESFETELPNGQVIPSKRVLWCLVDATTSRTVKTTHVAVTTYVASHKHCGTAAIMPRKAISISIKNPLESKALEQDDIRRMNQSSHNDAAKSYFMSNSKSLTGKVKWFSSYGEGIITVDSLGITTPVYACNIQGAKTGYQETACMFLKEGEQVTFDLFDFGTHLSATNVSGNVYFDADKWAKLDQDKLAFKKDAEGNFINGLF